jgi:hypothetical protein
MKHRNPVVYQARFANLRLHAFGIEQVLEWAADIEIYQARVTPELWRARPMFSHRHHKWESASAEDLMDLIAADFERCIRDFQPYPAPLYKTPRPSLRKEPGTDTKTG